MHDKTTIQKAKVAFVNIKEHFEFMPDQTENHN
jgi:hypothetical protein